MSQRVFVSNGLKYKKLQKQLYRYKGVSRRGVLSQVRAFCLHSSDSGRIRPEQLESCRRVLRRSLGRAGILKVHLVCDLPVSGKSTGIRMGKGKGAPEDWVAVVRPGRVMYEVEGVTEEMAREAFRLAHHKLPIVTKFLARQQGGL